MITSANGAKSLVFTPVVVRGRTCIHSARVACYNFLVKPGDRIEISMYSGEILDAIVSAVFSDVRGTMIRATSRDRVVTVKEEQCSLYEDRDKKKKR